MNLKQIEAFVAVAETKGFSQAAGRLYITQPTVSAHISSLEKELNTKLIARTTKAVELTKKGEEFYGYAKEMLALEQRMLNLFLDSSKKSNAIRISSSSVPAQYILPKVLGEFTRKYPNIRYNVVERDSLSVIRAVKEREIDVGFTGTKIDENECRFVQLCKDEIVVIAPNQKRYVDLMMECSCVDWIKQEPIIARVEGSGTRREAENILVKQGFNLSRLNIVAEYDSSDAIKRSVINGMGIAFISKLAIENELKNKELIACPLDASDKGRSLNMVYNNHVISSKLVSMFMTHVKDYYRNINKF